VPIGTALIRFKETGDSISVRTAAEEGGNTMAVNPMTGPMAHGQDVAERPAAKLRIGVGRSGSCQRSLDARISGEIHYPKIKSRQSTSALQGFALGF
jgi:hypothetical protein